MITFKQYLSEAPVVDLMTLLKKDCSPFLSQADGGLLIRGVSGLLDGGGGKDVVTPWGDTVKCWKLKVRKDREPKDMPMRVSKLADDWFKEEFGVKPRSEAVFAFGGAAKEAAEYGDRCVIFPIKKFKIVWSEFVDDLFSAYDAQIKEGNGFTGVSSRSTEEEFIYWLSQLGYQDTDLARAIKKDVEIMVVCNEYYAISDEDGDFEENIRKELS